MKPRRGSAEKADGDRNGNRVRSRDHAGRGVLVALFCCLVVPALSLSASALADQQNESGVERPSLSEIQASLGGEGPQPTEIDLTNSEVAEKLSHRDLDRAQAAELFTSVFEPVIEGAFGVFADLDTAKFHGDHVALLPSGGQSREGGSPLSSDQPLLVESALPLRTDQTDGTKSIVDLSLEKDGDQLQPANPLVDVGIPSKLGDGIVLPEIDIEISLVGAPAERSPSVINQTAALYPNTAQDSDFSVAPTPEGLETFSQLRSPDAPRRQTFELNLPTGASLASTADGGAEIKKDGQFQVVIPPPTALDAEGRSVPAHLEVKDNSLTVTAAPSATSSYPILVDPVYQVYTFGQLGAWGAPDFSGWYAFWDYAAGAFSLSTYDWCQGCGDIVYGLEMDSIPAGGIPLNSRVRWDYRVPRWNEWPAPTTYIDGATFGRVGFDVKPQENNWYVVDDPFFEYYLWDDNLGFISLGRRLGTEGNLSDPGWQYHLTNVAHNTNVKRASLELVSTQPHSQYRHTYIGDATIELTDNDYPAFELLQNPTQWVNDNPAAVPLTFRARDNGLGVYSIWVGEETAGGGWKSMETRLGCTGAAQAPCPRKWASAGGVQLIYDPASMAQGENLIQLAAVDALGRGSDSNPDNPGPGLIKVKVDHTAPSLTLTGTATEQGSLGTHLASYTLVPKATDGTAANPQSGIVKEVVKVDGLVTKEFSQTCSRNCDFAPEWKIEAAKYAEGEHAIEVIATDGVGLTTARMLTMSIEYDTTSPDLATNSEVLTAPGGWVNQQAYPYSVSATDAGGSGVTSIKLFIDGQVKGKSTGSCPNGGCSRNLVGSIDTSTYAGGSHSAELVVTDEAGNISRRNWTLNVNPSGEVSAGEAAATLEAVDDTSESQIVAPTDEVISAEEREDGNDPGLIAVGSDYVTTGTPNDSAISANPTEGFSIEAVEGSISATPIDPGGDTTAVSVVEGVAAAAGNIEKSVDTVTRPTFDGLTTFESIRGSSATENFAWNVELAEDQYLSQLDAQHVSVMFDEIHASFTIAAEPAHDALGTSVPTSLTVSGPNEVTLTVHHKSQPYVYPIVAGAGWKGGYVGNLSEMPPPEPIPDPPFSYPNLPRGQYVKVGPPIPLNPDDTDSEGALASSGRHRAFVRAFEFDQCAWSDSVGCWVFDAGLDGRWEYNGRFAWWKESKAHPSCPLDSHGGGMSLTYCDWIGPNHQRYGGGYHISAQVKYTLTGSFSAVFTNEEHMTAYLYGDGYGNSHDTAAICNPLSTC